MLAFRAIIERRSRDIEDIKCLRVDMNFIFEAFKSIPHELDCSQSPIFP